MAMINKLWDNCFLSEYSTTVEEVFEDKGQYWHAFKDTIFYVEGGGMASDIGRIDNYPVYEVKVMQGKIWHLLDVKLEGKVYMSINLHERFRKCQIHTAQHLISGMLKNVYKVETLSHHVGEEENDIELTLTNWNEKMMFELQVLCNGLIRDDLKVNISYPSRLEASKYANASKLNHEELRVVRIGNLDYNLCGCMHVPSLRYLQMIFLRGFEKTKNGYRIFYTVGDQLLNTVAKRYEVLDEASHSLALGHLYINSGIHHLQNDKKQLQKELDEWKERYFKVEASKLAAYQETFIIKEFDSFDVKSMTQLAQIIVKDYEKIVVFLTRNYDSVNLVIAKHHSIVSFDCNQQIQQIKQMFKLNGGGNETFAQAGGMYREELSAYIKSINEQA